MTLPSSGLWRISWRKRDPLGRDRPEVFEAELRLLTEKESRLEDANEGSRKECNDEPRDIVVPSLIPRDVTEVCLGRYPRYWRDPPDDLEVIEFEEAWLLDETGLKVSARSVGGSLSTSCLSISLAILASGDIWSSSLSDISMLTGTAESSVPCVGADASCFFCSSMDTGGEGGSRLAGCCTFATRTGGELRSNCWAVLFRPRVNRVAPGP
jgi:hypothetical protein